MAGGHWFRDSVEIAHAVIVGASRIRGGWGFREQMRAGTEKDWTNDRDISIFQRLSCNTLFAAIFTMATCGKVAGTLAGRTAGKNSSTPVGRLRVGCSESRGGA